MTPSNSALPVVAGLGTALPEHCMTQDAAVEMAQQICCRSETEQALARVLYRRSGVQRRHTAVPHETAYQYLNRVDAGTAAGNAEEPAAASRAAHRGDGTNHAANGAALAAGERATQGAAKGPTTGERLDLYREFAPPLALRAAAQALAAAGREAASITHLVTVSCTGFLAPGIDVTLIEGLGMRPTVERLNVGFMGCHGALNGLAAADAIVRARPQSRVLVCAVELCSLHYCFEWDPARAVGNAVFADGAAALVLEAPTEIVHPSNGHAAASQIGAGTARGWRLAATGSCLIPHSTDAMSWRIGDHGFEMYLSATVPGVIGEHLRPWLAAWLAEQGLAIEEVGSWAVHPGGPRILTAVEEALGLPRSATAVSREILAAMGNMSSPTVLFIVERLAAAGSPRPCVALGFGPGLTAQAALFL
ncbi:MAG TPA: type III polyketide synthase [Pirellulales bacterium]|nr:type III polyketide synthase [Pirellulales bacterium]